MAPVTRLFPGDAEAAKRDDDHVPGSSSSIRLAWQHRRRLIRRPRWQRVLLFLGLLVAIYYFIKNIPTDLRPPRQRPSYSDQSHSLSHVNHAQVADNGDKMNDNAHSDNSPHVVPIGKPKQQVSQKGGSHVDDGLAKLDALERTLRRGFHRWSGRAHEQNVVR